MVHNGIEYGLMAAYAEGFNIIKHANVGLKAQMADAETTPLRHPEHYKYDIDVGAGRRGLAARQRGRLLAARPDRQRACAKSPDLDEFRTAAFPIPAKAAGRCWRRSTRACRRR